MKRTKQPYKKYIYWLKEKQLPQLQAILRMQNIKLKFAKRIVCTPMDRISKIAVVAPKIWNEACRRQGSWYRTSERKGLYLIISQFELADFGPERAAVITESDFVLPQPASAKKKEILLKTPILEKRVPAEWHQVNEKDKKIYLRWARRMGSTVEDYDQLYKMHTANHANFITPKCFIEDGDGIIPYSIDGTAHVCSCCVELFQVLGSRFKRKLVIPCPGAAIFARLKPDRYLLVEKP